MFHIFPVRHFSPKASHELLALCDTVRPDCLLIEAPSDAAALLYALVAPDVVPPVAILAYTNETLTRSYTLPFVEYSPEYVAVRWAIEHGAAIECVDLPFSASLALPPPESGEEGPSAYELCAQAAGATDFDTYFEAYFEKSGTYREAALALGETLRALSHPDEHTLLRERYMRRRIREVAARGDENLVLVCGAYHAPAFRDNEEDSETEALPFVDCSLTLIPYAYPRLTTQFGYGAGNASPKYHELLWKYRQDPSQVPVVFLSGAAVALRDTGEVSSAAVADAVVLARTLASLRGREPVLEDLRAAAVAVLGQGDADVVADSLKLMEIGDKAGIIPSGKWRSPLQDDFHRAVRELKLMRVLTAELGDITLDLRGIAGKDTLDRRRSAFLHRLRILGVPIAMLQDDKQNSRKEVWTPRYTAETEITLAEAVDYGVTIKAAASGAIREALSRAGRSAAVAEITETALRCDLPEMFTTACDALRNGLEHSGGFLDAVQAADALDRALQAEPDDSVRRKALTPLLQRLCLRACLDLPGCVHCDDEEAVRTAVCIQTLHRLCGAYNEAGELACWREAIARLSESIEAHPRLSGLAFALRLERGEEDAGTLVNEMYSRLSAAFSVEHAAVWLDGLISRNRRALLAIPELWENIDNAIASLDETRFRRALVPLRRMFSRFSERERRDIANRLAAHWGDESADDNTGLSGLTAEEQEMLSELQGLNVV